MNRLFIFSLLLVIATQLTTSAVAQGPVERSPLPALSAAQPPSQPVANPSLGQAPSPSKAPRGFFKIIFSGGWTGFSIILFLVLLSIGGLALAVEHLLTIRHDVLMPPGLSNSVSQHLSTGDLPSADGVCLAQPSVLSFVLRAGLAEVEGGWQAVEKAMEDAIAEQAARLLRKIEYLSVLGNIAPMVGLLGTVIGMIFAFQEVADTQGAARAGELASGIYQALVTTVGGLLVAIPSLGAYAVFRNRADQLIAETAYTAQHAMLPIKRAQFTRRTPPKPPAR